MDRRDRRRGRAGALIGLLLASAATGVVSRSPEPSGLEQVNGQSADEALEAYLERLRLNALLAEQLETKLGAMDGAASSDKQALAERLAKLYVDLLSTSTNADDRERWASKAQKLLDQVPEIESFALRLNLHRVVYQRAEEVVEKHRLRLATPEDVAQAETTLRAVADQFEQVGAKVHQRVSILEKAESVPENAERVSAELAEMRRLRSLAFYYAGWANLYVATVGTVEPAASEAMRNFGWLLNTSGNRPAQVDRVQPSMYQYEHISRAAMGCALAAGLKGNDTEALRWLDAIVESGQAPQGVLDQLPSRRLIVLAGAGRWFDVELLIRRERRALRSGPGPDTRPLPPAMARLLAVYTLEADRRSNLELIERLTRTALGDLVAEKQVSQVLDLVSRYGNVPLGDTGFIPNFVRAVQSYESARKAQQGAEPSAGEADEPTTDPKLINEYRQAAGLFAAAEGQADAKEYPVERVRAGVMHGRALYFGGALTQSADQFLKAWETAGKGADAEEPLWLAVLALDRAVRVAGAGRAEAPAEISERLKQTAAVFLQTYPQSDKAARLAVMQAEIGAIAEEDALRVLSEVKRDSPVYESARRQIARIQYGRFRNSRAQERDFAAQKFLSVAEDLLVIERAQAMGSDAKAAVGASERAIIRARQMLDALLSVSAPDVRRAESVLMTLRGVAAYNNTDLRPIEAELAFRELQIALALGEGGRVGAAAKRMVALSDSAQAFGPAADRLIYRFATQRWQGGDGTSRAGMSAGDLRELILTFGTRIIERDAASASALSDASMVTLVSTVAAAAFEGWKETKDTTLRDRAMALDARLLASGLRLEPSLRRLGATREDAGDAAGALEAWRALAEGATPGSEPWFEGRYATARVMAKVDPPKARDLIGQIRAVYPSFGTGEWGQKFKELEATLPAPSPAPGAGDGTTPARPAGGAP